MRFLRKVIGAFNLKFCLAHSVDQSSGRSPVSPGFAKTQPPRFTPEGGPGKLRPVSISVTQEVFFCAQCVCVCECLCVRAVFLFPPISGKHRGNASKFANGLDFSGQRSFWDFYGFSQQQRPLHPHSYYATII